jgi:hypothetical protein
MWFGVESSYHQTLAAQRGSSITGALGSSHMTDEALLQQTYVARDRYLCGLGVVEPDVLAPLVNPTFMGGPMWPDLRQAWRVIHRTGSTAVISDGLSDPFSDEADQNVGFGIEVLAESSDRLTSPLQDSWLFDVAYQVSQQCAAHGGVCDLIDRLGLISLELPLSDALEPVATSNGRAGVLLGVAAPDIPLYFHLPSGRVRVLTAKVLWPSELEYAIENGKVGREALAKYFASDGSHHRSSLQRKPVV